MNNQQTRRVCLNLLSVLFVTQMISCANSVHTRPSGWPNRIDYTDTRLAENRAAQYIQLAEQAQSPQREQLILKAAEQWLNARNQTSAGEALKQVDNKPLPPEMRQIKQLLKARLALSEDKPKQSLMLLATLPATQSLPHENQIDLLKAKAQAEALLGYPLQAVKDRVALSTKLSDDMARDNNDALIWELLSAVPKEKIARVKTERHTQYNGWLTLALLAKTDHFTAEQLEFALNRWHAAYPEHPGRAFMRPGPQRTDRRNAWQHIALLLPLNGPHKASARAIRDGFLNTYYTQAGNQKTVKLYDSSQQAANHLYHQAIMAGADIVVGPLTKQQVVRLSKERLSAPVLALNYLPDGVSHRRQLFQFGLAPEDEARQAAQQAWQDGHVRAAVIVPKTAWGDRLAHSFTTSWQQLGGQVVDTLRFNRKGNLSKPIAALLHIPDSKQRTRQIQQLIQQPIEAQPRRRQDLDAIFLAAEPTQARQIGPILRFFYATDIPIYATSSIYTGVSNIAADSDINGAIFCDAPWIIDRQYNDAAQPGHTSRYQRFYALGMDAYQLIDRISKLSDFHGLRFEGATGHLAIDTHGRIVRRLPCAQFVKGKPRRIASIETSHAR